MTVLSASRTHLLVIDFQERLVPAIHDHEAVLATSSIVLAAAGQLALPVTVTRQYPKGLGDTVAAIRDALPADAQVLDKLAFSAAREETIATIIAGLASRGRDQIVIVGIEAHVCVLQTALDLKDAGYGVFVVGDAVSSRKQASVDAARTRLVQRGCAWITAEMALFEWMERAGTDSFRAISRLIR